MNLILNYLTSKYLYIVGLCLVLLAILDIVKAFKDKEKTRLILLLAVFLVAVIVPLGHLFTKITVETEEFSTARDNIAYINGNDGNIILKTKKTIEEPIDLRIKDRWIHLTYLTDYSIKDNNEVMINYEFGNNDIDNKMVAETGLIFTYKGRQLR
jgi:hypothetical protein